MTKPISDYTVDELSKKIEAIKAERERTANALKRYEEELERKKQENPLGVPCESSQYGMILGTYCFGFVSDKEKKVFDGLLKDYVEALQKLARDEPIDIKVLLPLLKKGYVAYEKEYGWIWFKNKPFILKGTEEDATWTNEGSYSIIGGFNIKPAENWEESLMECGL